MSWVVILIKMTFSIALPSDWLHGEIVIFYVLANQLFIDDLLYVLVEFYTVYSLRISDIFRATYEYYCVIKSLWSDISTFLSAAA